MELLLARAPENEQLGVLARRMGVEGTPWPTVTTAQRDCVLCGLCTAVCEEIIGASAIGFSGRGETRAVSSPFHQPAEDCIACGACAAICPVGTIRIRLHLAEGEMEISPFKTRVKLQTCRECGQPVASVAVSKQVLEKCGGQWEKFRQLAQLCPRCRRRMASAVAAAAAGAGPPKHGPAEE